MKTLITLDTSLQNTTKINPNLFSGFVEHLGKGVYDGIWVGKNSSIDNISGIRTDTIEAIKEVEIPLIRWPGGCFADTTYHWKDGIGPRKQRPITFNKASGEVESNQFGTEEFLEFCRLINAQPLLSVNVGSGSPQEASEWVEYCNIKDKTTLSELRKFPNPYNVEYWGIGNEVWGCGGNMTPEYYANLYKRFVKYMKKTKGPDLKIKMLACGSTENNFEWNYKFFEAMRGTPPHISIDYLGLHVYSGKGLHGIQNDDNDYYSLIQDTQLLKTILEQACNLAREYSTNEKPTEIALDEWGTQLYECAQNQDFSQPNTMRDAIFTCFAFHQFFPLSERLSMTNMAQMINVGQSLLVTKNKNLIKTPTYHVYKMLKPHRNSNYIESNLKNCPELPLSKTNSIPSISVSASYNQKTKKVFCSIVNLDLYKKQEVKIDIKNIPLTKIVKKTILSGKTINELNSFDFPNSVTPKNEIANTSNLESIEIPKHSIITFLIETK